MGDPFRVTRQVATDARLRDVFESPNGLPGLLQFSSDVSCAVHESGLSFKASDVLAATGKGVFSVTKKVEGDTFLMGGGGG